MRRVAITGLGLITPLGVGLEPFWNGLMEGRTGIRPLEGFDLDGMPTSHYAQMPAFDMEDYLDAKESSLWSHVSRLSVIGSVLARRDAALDEIDPPRTGVILGTGYGGTFELQDLYDTFFNRGWKRIKPVSVPKMMPNAMASHIAIYNGARGVNFTVSTACSSGAIATGLAAQQIRAGSLDCCITGGLDYVINKSTAAAWNNLRVLDRRDDPTGSRPFSADRKGLVFGEGAAILILEEWEQAKARGARIYSELVGVGATCDAVSIVGPDMTGEIEAMHQALADAGISADDIDYVSAHGTGTPVNDANESRVLKEVFGQRAYELPISGIKGHLGHTMGAAGAIEVAATSLMLKHQRVAPTLNWVAGDPDCDLDYVTEGPRDVDMTYAMSNSFGFGGQNSVLIFKRA